MKEKNESWLVPEMLGNRAEPRCRHRRNSRYGSVIYYLKVNSKVRRQVKVKKKKQNSQAKTNKTKLGRDKVQRKARSRRQRGKLIRKHLRHWIEGTLGSRENQWPQKGAHRTNYTRRGKVNEAQVKQIRQGWPIRRKTQAVGIKDTSTGRK